MFAQLWEYWHSRQYEEAASEVCRLVGVEEEAFSSQRQLLTAAGAVHASECPAWSEEDRSVALLGRNCCNRLAERSLRNSNWPEAARWCALAWRLEGGQSCASLWLEDGSWAAARYQRLFHAAEVFRLACKGRGQKASKKAKPEEGGFDGSEYLQASRRCLETCEAILQRHPASPGPLDLSPPSGVQLIFSHSVYEDLHSGCVQRLRPYNRAAPRTVTCTPTTGMYVTKDDCLMRSCCKLMSRHKGETMKCGLRHTGVDMNLSIVPYSSMCFCLLCAHYSQFVL